MEPHALRRQTTPTETVHANRRWWDSAAAEYQAEHGAFLRDGGFVWGPEGLDEVDAHLLGADLAGRRALEVGCGAGQCSRWLAAQGAQPVAFDISAAQLAHARAIDVRRAGVGSIGTARPGAGPRIPLVQADAGSLPFSDATFDLACSAYGAVPFVADSASVMREVARVLRPGGRWVFSVTHPVRWCFPDDPGEAGLVASEPYWDRTPYVEQDSAGMATYVEHHRTLGDRVREISAAGMHLVGLVEPEWPEGHTQVWGGWSPTRGRVLPGTAIFVCAKPRTQA